MDLDLGYTIPPMVNFILFWLFGSWNWELVASSISVPQFSVLKLVFIIFAMMLLLFFLFTSAEIPLNLSTIRLRAGHFSIALTTSLMASLFLPPSLFWAVYLLIVFLSPWHHMFFELLKHFFRLFSNTSSLIPPYTIISFAQNEESPTPGSARVGVDVDTELELEQYKTETRLTSRTRENDD